HDLFAQFWREHAAQHRFHVVDQVVDDAVVTQLKTGIFDQGLGSFIRTYVETDYRSFRSFGQLHVGFRNTTYAVANNVDRNFVVTAALECSHDDFKRTTHVYLEHDVEDH